MVAPILHSSQVRELVSGKKVLQSVDIDDTLESALTLFREQDILAAPVRALKPQAASGQSSAANGTGERNEQLPQAGGGRVYPSKIRFVGMLSVADIALFLAKQRSEGSAQAPAGSASFRVRDVMGRTEETRHMLVLDPHATVAQAMEMLGARGFHRALVPNVCPNEHGEGAMPLPALLQAQVGGASGEEFRVLAQADVISFLLRHEGLLGLSLAKSLDDIGLVWPSVVAVTPQTSLVRAFDLFRTRGVSAVAVVAASPPPVEVIPSPRPTPPASHLHDVVSGTGHALLGTMSASDVRAVGEGVLRSLTAGTTVAQFLGMAHGAAAAAAGKVDKAKEGENGTKIKARLVTCTKDTHLRQAMQLLLEHRVHRLWVVDESKATEEGPLLAGVVSMTDILRMMRVLPVVDPSAVAEVEEQMQDAEEDFKDWDFDSFLWLDWWPVDSGEGGE